MRSAEAPKSLKKFVCVVIKVVAAVWTQGQHESYKTDFAQIFKNLYFRTDRCSTIYFEVLIKLTTVLTKSFNCFHKF